MKRLPVVLALVALAVCAVAQRFPERPDGTFVADEAHLLNASDKAAVTAAAQRALDATGAPVVVATVPSLASVDAQQMGVEKYAQALFDAWGIGTQANNRGVLLVVAKNDRKARIEFGKAWAHQLDGQAHSIMGGTILAAFRQNDYSGGIRRGAEALANLVTQPGAASGDASSPQPVPYTSNADPIPEDPEPDGFPLLLLLFPIGFVVFLIFAVARGIRRGAFRLTGGGYGGYYDTSDTTSYDTTPIVVTTYDSGSSDSGSYDSGSYDSGGSSGGGGDTGSW